MTTENKGGLSAPKEYPIRARVKPEGSQYYWPSMRAMVGGIHDFMRHESGSYYCRNGWAWAPANLEIISDAVGVPELQAKGPSSSPVTPSPTKAPVVDLETIEARHKEAIRGPWYNGQAQDGEILPDGSGYAGDYYDTDEIVAPVSDDADGNLIGQVQEKQTRTFIIHAWEDVRALIAEVRSLRSSNEVLRKALEDAAWACKLGAELLELAGLDSKDRIEAHKRLFDAYCNGTAALGKAGD